MCVSYRGCLAGVLCLVLHSRVLCVFGSSSKWLEMSLYTRLPFLLMSFDFVSWISDILVIGWVNGNYLIPSIHHVVSENNQGMYRYSYLTTWPCNLQSMYHILHLSFLTPLLIPVPFLQYSSPPFLSPSSSVSNLTPKRSACNTTFRVEESGCHPSNQWILHVTKQGCPSNTSSWKRAGCCGT